MGKAAKVLRDECGKLVVVHTGFSWGAFVFGPFWAIAKRQWMLFLVLTIAAFPIDAVLILAEQKDNPGFLLLGGLLTVVYMFSYGVWGNRWHRLCLERKGYVDASEHNLSFETEAPLARRST